ncbi:MAG: DUF1778 domain-containing protein [Chlorobium sp.]|nr:DUF1778 domain-containing protein [Chlorobium sp.]
MSTNLKQKGVKEPAGTNNKLNPATRVSSKQLTEGKTRLEARITRNVHAQIKRAAEIQGRTVTDFVVYAALEAATKAIEENSVIQLSLEGQLAFAEALLNPPEPNAALRRAFESHAKLFGQDQ